LGENAWHKKVCSGALTLKARHKKLELGYKRKYG
jgi:hypothetical protein